MISVIIPVYNEEETVQVVIRKVLDVLAKNRLDGEIIVVDDGSQDQSLQLAEQLVRETKAGRIQVIAHPSNLAKGAAIRTGLRHSQKSVVIIQDCDMEYDPEEIPRLVQPILHNRADVCFGSRLINGVNPNMRLMHVSGNKVLSMVASILLRKKVSDIMTGHKAFRKEILDPDQLSRDGFDCEIEMAFKLLTDGNRFSDLPTRYTLRQNGEAKISRIDGFKSLWRIYRCTLRA